MALWMGTLPACPTHRCKTEKLLCPCIYNTVAAETDVELKEEHSATTFTTGKLPRKRKPREAYLTPNLKTLRLCIITSINI